MFDFLKRWRLGRRMAELRPSTADFHAVLRDFPCLAGFDHRQRIHLLDTATRILADKTFVGAGGLQPDYMQCLTVATLAALPVLNLKPRWYADFETIILYADTYTAEIEEVDEAGVVHRGRDLRAGEAWYRGPVVLALSDVAESGQGGGFNVVVHEMIHQMDNRNGDADGFPPLRFGHSARDWSRTFSSAYEAFLEDLDAGRELPLDDYAATSPAEFLAVAGEAFFDCPGHLLSHMPDIYRNLEKFFRQDPANRLPR